MKKFACSSALFASLAFWFAFAAKSAETKLSVPDPAGVLAKGTPAETPWFIKDSGQPGPVVFISGGIHGDETAGAAAATEILRWPIAKGKLILLPRANVVALKAGRRNTPDVEEELSNLNRNFPQAAKEEPARGTLAPEIWDVVRAQRPAWLLDLHEAVDFGATNKDSVGSSIIVQPTESSRAAAALMLEAVNRSISDPTKKFRERKPPVDGSLARAAGEHLGANAMILETTKKGQTVEFRVRQHLMMVHRLLQHLGMVDAERTLDAMIERYEERRIEGWRVLVNERLLAAEQAALRNDVLRLLGEHLYCVKRVVPEGPLAKLRQIPIYIELNHPRHPCMCHHESAGWLRENGFDPAKAGAVELANPATFLKWTQQQPWMVLHELAHGYHSRFLGGINNAEIKACYEKAVAAKNYESVLHINGTRRRHYALNNPMEYFAEATEAFFGTNDFYPFVRAELKEHDPAMFELLEKVWETKKAE
ncbi:MAG: succinylglutamate desuccinylase/aspartoacylase family protein [Verrucomicrobia bacterium]|nr:succinylglutamate desuccinylase/aspartoacylase family protein [Verrucomicrobiota bacterium]